MGFSISQKMLVAFLLLAAFAFTVTFTVLSAVNVSQNVASAGVVKTSPNIGVYSDSACTISMTSINWGTIAAGGSAKVTAYVKNTGTGTMTLALAASSWSPPAASSYVTVSWNQQGTKLAYHQSAAATITITVAPNITGVNSFSNTIVISGSS
jgi:hypothetical protein